MSKVQMCYRAVKPAVCECSMIRKPIAPCETFDGRGLPGIVVINGTEYTISILGYLPKVGEPVIDGYRLTKSNGESHDICLVGGRLECTCGDYEFRRATAKDLAFAECKHGKAIRQLCLLPRDQYQPAYASGPKARSSGCPCCGSSDSECGCWDNP